MTAPELPELTKAERDAIEDCAAALFERSDSLMAVVEAWTATARRRKALEKLQEREGRCL